ncbi:PqqD family protein [Sphaerisporangium sp. NPDC088356]|uniref:PqqD family protein n=1 Tax=Sphaerisporangium sp. NPDC088356 TaxID=3154871 RepID=UPI003413AEC6
MSLQINDAVIWQETEEGISLYHTETGEFHSLNATAARIWTLIASDGEREPIISKLSREFAGSSALVSSRIRMDVEDFIGTMIKDELIEELPA